MAPLVTLGWKSGPKFFVFLDTYVQTKKHTEAYSEPYLLFFGYLPQTKKQMQRPVQNPVFCFLDTYLQTKKQLQKPIQNPVKERAFCENDFSQNALS